MVLVSKLDEFGKLAWLAATLLGFWVFWPLGVAIIAFLACSGRLRGWRQMRRGHWTHPAASVCNWSRPPASGNRAFDDYRAETLRRLEEEQREFMEYLERLRQAKDKAEFDQFMADRRSGPPVPEQPQQA